ncbi:MAG: hypothetical protein HY421_00205 [Candidatus Kerfeldbacteria bacterium]|nr:hypothetical protein [Candidatus Kerfeldbacteria bacterium]
MLFTLGSVHGASAVEPTKVSEFVPAQGIVYDVEKSGTYLYLGAYRGLLILDVTDKNKPKLIGSYETLRSEGSYISDLEVVGSYVYAAVQPYGLFVFDVSDPTSPKKVGSYKTIGYQSDKVTMVGNYAYLSGSLLQIIDVSTPASPTFKKNIALSGAAGRPFVSSTKLYVPIIGGSACSSPGSLVIYDVADKLNPVMFGSVATKCHALSVVVEGNTAYVADGTGGLVTIDVTNSTAPTFLGQYDTANYAANVALNQSTAYVSDGNSIVTLNVSAPAAPTLASNRSINTGGASPDLIVTDDSRMYLSGGNRAVVYILNTESPALDLVHTFKTRFPFKDVFVTRSMSPYALAIDSVMGMWVIDTAATGGPTALTLYDTPGTPQRVIKHGAQAYIADKEGGLVILDVDKSIPAGSEPPPIQAPKLLARYTKAKLVWDVDLFGKYAYLAAGAEGVWVLDISNPSKPKRVGVYPTANDLRYIEVVGNYAYVAGNRGAIITLDVSNPRKPTRTSVISHRSTRLLRSSRLYSAALTKGLNVFSLSDPTRPRLLGNVDTKGTAWSVTMGGSKRAYVADGKQGIAIIDVSKSSKPVQLATYKVKGGDVRAISKPYGLLVVAAGTVGIIMVDVTGI